MSKWDSLNSLFVIASFLFIFSNCTPSQVSEPKESTFEYGICVDTFSVIKGQVEAGQTLGAILYLNHIDHGRIDQIVRASKGIFDFRKVKAGQDYTVIGTNDSIQKAQFFIYETSRTDYVVFDIRDTISVLKGQKEIEIKLKESSGMIESSLWNALVNNDMSPALVMELSSIYAWTIDFFRIQKGDHFKIIYEERFVEGEFIGIGKIYAALFNHTNEDFYAFYFEEEQNYGDYFDEKGGALRKAFLRAPLNFSRISSRYSKRRRHPVTGRVKAHLGTDYAAPTGTPILSTANGTITEARYKKNNGNYVKIRHNSTYSTQYLHMSKIKSGIRPGVYVKQGDVIGYVGSTGLATGPHVCYRFWKNGVQVDPYKQKLPPSKPVKKENRAQYDEVKDSLMTVLHAIPSNF
ncbi:MAG: peptidoglycan DD-metalloendopeptidase family protein [Flavobacteriales bacterium]